LDREKAAAFAATGQKHDKHHTPNHTNTMLMNRREAKTVSIFDKEKAAQLLFCAASICSRCRSTNQYL
jgi:hypothetical protein